MLTQSAIVVSWEKGIATLKIVENTLCNKCMKKDNCIQLFFRNMKKNKFNLIKIPSKKILIVGQRIELAINEKVFLYASILVYLLPLFSLFLVSGFFKIYFDNEYITILGAWLGIIIGFLIIHVLYKRLHYENKLQYLIFTK